ncbi:MAG: cupin, partial [Sphingomonadaceae bacterium]|nr:cupin [Sphingomonadaceae bacterium]
MPNLLENPVHLGLGATVIVQPPFTGMEWYVDYVTRNSADGAEGRLVTMSRFTADWESWEMHPEGDEMVLCLSGRMTLHQDHAVGT